MKKYQKRLQRKNSMKTYGIIVAMNKEITMLKEKITILEEHKICNLTFLEGTYNNCKVILSTAGIGKVNAGITTILMIEHFKPDLIINTGIAGGYNENLKPLDIIVAEKVLYSDVDMTSEAAGSYPFGQLEGLPEYFSPSVKYIDNCSNLHLGTILTGDQFVVNYEKFDRLVKQYFPTYNVIGCDMESGSISQVCTLNNVEFLIIRAISDIIGSTTPFDYSVFSSEAADKVSTFVLSLIK